MENRSPGERLTRLSEASLRINETLGLDTVWQEALDSQVEATLYRCPPLTCSVLCCYRKSIDEEGPIRPAR